MSEIKLCECGCGEPTNKITRPHAAFGRVVGEYSRFKRGHSSRKGLRTITKDGYIDLWMPEHPAAKKKGYVVEHIVICEKALGKRLPKGAQIHHVDGDKSNNTPSNLVICQDQAYHSLLHVRQAARAACGNANWRRCVYCQKYDDVVNMRDRNRNNPKIKAESWAHPACPDRKYT